VTSPSTANLAEERQRQPLLRRFTEQLSIGIRERPAQSIRAYVAVLWLLSIALWAALLPNLTPFIAPFSLTWPVLAILFFVAERFVIDLEVREQTHSFSLSEIALVLGLVFAAPVDLLIGQALGAGLALALRAGQRPIKLLFNIGNFALSTGVALLVFRSIVTGPDPSSPLGWLAAFAAALSSDFIAATNVAIVIYLSQQERPNLGSLFGSGTLYTLVAPSIALIAATVLWHAPHAAWLLVVMAVVTFIVLRFHGRELRRVRSVSRLHESTRNIQQSFSLDEVARALLTTARNMFEGEMAELLLFPPSGDEGRLLRMTADEEKPNWMEFQLDPREGVWARIAAEGRGLIVRDAAGSPDRGGRLLASVRSIGRPTDDTADRILSHFRARGIRGAIVAPLRVEDAIVGTLLVANRRGSWTDWTAGDLTLLETLANHAGVSIQNSRQADELANQRDELERRSTHDALTGLPNRVLFHRDVAGAIAADGAGGGSVLLLDLDRFKEVNDTLGHHNGDRLLVEVADRLKARFGESETVARLGGDEFAVLVRRSDLADVIAAAETILAEFDSPFVVQGVTVQVEASVGISRYPAQGEDPDTLLRRADVAMYHAKGGHTRYSVYEAARDPYSEARLALLSELRRAIERRELTVFYQAQAEATTGRVSSVEALVRWRHPQRGELPPDEFVGLAEHSEVIHALTSFVIETAVRQCAEWHAQGLPVRVAVNLSARSLHNTSLADEVARVLGEHGLPASALELEITETSIEADPAGTDALVQRLHELGVGVAIDDFGTGYSAFSYLQRLPIDEIKIDRSFVMGMETDERKLQIVRSTIQLAHNLGVRVVAEGVETEAVQKRLARLGCDLVQGYVVSRAMSADMIGGVLRRPARTVPAGRAAASGRQRRNRSDESETSDRSEIRTLQVRRPAV
jgi:diguanylate cyclase (GGDEF)-like protein